METASKFLADKKIFNDTNAASKALLKQFNDGKPDNNDLMLDIDDFTKIFACLIFQESIVNVFKSIEEMEGPDVDLKLKIANFCKKKIKQTVIT